MKKSTASKPQQKVSNKNAPSNSQSWDSLVPGWTSWIWLGAFLFLVAYIRFQFLQFPFERDEGAYTMCGIRLLEGGIPYLNFYEQKPPGIFLSYAIMLGIFGKTLGGIHFGFIILNLAAITLFFLLLKKTMGPVQACIGSVTFGILSMNPIISGFSVQAEHILVLCAIAGIACLALHYYSKPMNGMLFLAGWLLMWSLTVKQNGVFFLAAGGMFMVFHWIWPLQKGTKSPWLKELLWFSAGAALPLILQVVYVVAMGGYEEMIFWVFTFPSKYISSITLEQGYTTFFGRWNMLKPNYAIFLYPSFVGYALIYFSSVPRALKFTLVFFGLMCFLSIVPGLRFYGHYWLQIMPGAAIGFALLVDEIIQLSARIKAENFAKPILVVVFLFICFNHFSVAGPVYFKPNYDKILKMVYGSNPFPEAKKLSDFVARRAAKGDKVAVLGSEPEIYFYLQEPMKTNHYYLTYLVDPRIEQAKTWSKEFLDEMDKNKPKFLFFVNHPFSWMLQKDYNPEVFDYYQDSVQKYYHPIAVADQLNDLQTKYMWDADVNTYKIQGKSFIYVWERNP